MAQAHGVCGGMHMLVIGCVRFGGHWHINVSVRGCGGIGVMARGRIGTLMCWHGCGGVRWHIGVGHVCRGRMGCGCTLACWCVSVAASIALGACAGVGTWGVYRLALAHGDWCTSAHWHLVCRHRAHVGMLALAHGCWCSHRRGVGCTSCEHVGS